MGLKGFLKIRFGSWAQVGARVLGLDSSRVVGPRLKLKIYKSIFNESTKMIFTQICSDGLRILMLNRDFNRTHVGRDHC